ncbi:MAG: EAL domain-containing protein [Pseudomonadota bacterium]
MALPESLLQPPEQPLSAPRPARVLVVDDDPMVCSAVTDLIGSHDRYIFACGTGREAMRLLSAEAVDLLLLDLSLPDTTGLEIMRWMQRARCTPIVIVVSGDDSIDSAIRALKLGAYEYIRKPFEPAALTRSVENALASKNLEAENARMRALLEHSERLHRYLVDNSPDLIFALDANGRFRFVNDRFATVVGYTKAEIAGLHYASVLHEKNPAHLHWLFGERRTGGRASKDIEFTLRRKTADADSEDSEKLVTVAASAIGIYREGVEDEPLQQRFVGTYVVGRDITARKRAEKIIEFHAYHDALTGLPNRTLFRDRLSQAIAFGRRHQRNLAVLFIDMDRFKLVNDTFGHLTGDQLLQQAASRIRKCLRATDTLCRIGGDEFIALVSELEGREDAERVATKVLEELNTPFALGQRTFTTGASIGVAVFPEDGIAEEELIRNADAAMYQAKRRGKNRTAFFSADLNASHQERLRLEHDLREAVQRKEFEVFFQPIHNVRTAQVESLEALVRWRHPLLGLLAPNRFIHIAEESGHIRDISEFVLDAACEHLAGWRSSGFPELGVSVNLSPQDFDRPDLVERVMHYLDRHSVPSGALELEITENVLIEDMDAVSRTAARLRSEGVRIAIDDFGTRYSSLAYLQSLPINAIKIDQSFVRDLGLRGSSSSIVRAMIGIARGLELDFIAEGVERDEHLKSLQEFGCDVMQGFLFSRPMPGPEVGAYLARSMPH